MSTRVNKDVSIFSSFAYYIDCVEIYNCTNYATITGCTYVDEIWRAENISSDNYENCTKI